MAGSFWNVTRSSTAARRGCEQGFPGLGETATDDQRAGVQQGERGDEPVGEGVDGVLPDPYGGGVAGFDGLRAVGGVGVGVAAGLGPCLAHQHTGIRRISYPMG
ncbi:hypothetical protein STANM309S_05827 [Streptomyces tanashiensis]